MHVYLWAITVMYLVGIVLNITLIGVKREPKTKGMAALDAVVGLACAIVAALYASGVWK